MVIRQIAVGVIAIGLATNAAAQSSSTICNRIGNATSCHTQQRPGTDWDGNNRSIDEQNARLQDNLRALLQPRQPNKQQQLEESYARAEAENQAARVRLSALVKENVGKALSEGRCADAITEALRYREIDLAAQAKAFCATTGK